MHTHHGTSKHLKCFWNELLKSSPRIAENLLKFYSPSGHPKDEFESSEEQIWRYVALHHLLTNGSSAVNGCRQNESPNSW